MRARIEDCSAATEPTREEVYLAVEESYRALAVRPPVSVEPLAPLPLIPEQETAVALLTSWVCRHPYDLPATFRLARLHFEHRRFEEAIVYFARVGDGPVEDDLSAEAFFRWLEVVNLVGSRLSVVSCYDEMEEKVTTTRDRLCDFDLVARHPGRTPTCTAIGHVNYNVDRMRLQYQLNRD